jgi:hypothetical protein
MAHQIFRTLHRSRNGLQLLQSSVQIGRVVRFLIRLILGSRQRSSECQRPGKNVSRAWACIRPTDGIHDVVEIRFYWELRGVLLTGIQRH